jgi:hypothetical protein
MTFPALSTRQRSTAGVTGTSFHGGGTGWGGRFERLDNDVDDAVDEERRELFLRARPHEADPGQQ